MSFAIDNKSWTMITGPGLLQMQNGRGMIATSSNPGDNVIMLKNLDTVVIGTTVYAKSVGATGKVVVQDLDE